MLPVWTRDAVRWGTVGCGGAGRAQRTRTRICSSELILPARPSSAARSASIFFWSRPGSRTTPVHMSYMSDSLAASVGGSLAPPRARVRYGVRDAACPICTGWGARRVHLVRGGGDLLMALVPCVRSISLIRRW